MNVQSLAEVAIPHELKGFGFNPEEERIAVSRLLNLTEEQPCGVFLFEFKTRRPYLKHLRWLLSGEGGKDRRRKPSSFKKLKILRATWDKFPQKFQKEQDDTDITNWVYYKNN